MPTPTIRQPAFDETLNIETPDPTQKRQEHYLSMEASDLAHRLCAAEEELTAHRVEAAKRLSLHLNKRLMALIEEWKEVQSQLAVAQPSSAQQTASLRQRSTALAAKLTDQ